MSDDDCQRLRAVVDARDNPGRTHWDGCYLDPTHRDCAITLLLAERDRLAIELEQANNTAATACKRFAEVSAELAELRAACEPFVVYAGCHDSKTPDQHRIGWADMAVLNDRPAPTVGDCRRIAAMLARTPEEGR